MIQANELRIGNWITGEFANGEQKQFQIFRIDGDDDMQDIKGIPLTPEWLERCRFKKKQIGYYWDREYCVYYNNGGPHEYAFAFRGNHLRNDLQYLHQLQNLYFSLTGEELTINL